MFKEIATGDGPAHCRDSNVLLLGRGVAGGIITGIGEVSELADEHDLGSCAARRAGSSPAFPIYDALHRHNGCQSDGRCTCSALFFEGTAILHSSNISTLIW